MINPFKHYIGSGMGITDYFKAAVGVAIIITLGVVFGIVYLVHKEWLGLDQGHM